MNRSRCTGALIERRLLLAVFLGVLVALFLATSPKTEPAEAQTSCGSIQTRVNNAARGATVNLPDGCIYRQTVTINKPLTLIGGPGVQIRGSNVWSNWTQSGSFWKSGNSVPAFSSHNNGSGCEVDLAPSPTSRCLWPEQVFLGGKPLTQVASNPQSGQFAIDSNRKVVLKDDPRGRTVEVTVRKQWVVGRASGVSIEGFTMTHAASGQREGAIANNAYSNWSVKNSNLSHTYGAIVSLIGENASGLSVIGNDIHHGGQLGIHGGGNLLIQNNKIHHNNTEWFRTGWSAGGFKGVVRSLRAVGNEVYSNNGSGMWTDVGGGNILYSDNRIHHNLKAGIHLEKISNAEIKNNVIWENGWRNAVWGWGAGILSSSSRELEIHHNTLAWNADGISIISQDREKPGLNSLYDYVKNVHVYNNTILAKDYPSLDRYHNYSLAWLQDWPGVMGQPSSNNWGRDNLYGYVSAEGNAARFRWVRDSYRLLRYFNGSPGEERGIYLTTTQINNIVSLKGIPARPSH